MPAARNTHRAPRHAPLGSSSGRSDDEIISLSSDDGFLLGRQKPKKSGKKKTKPPPDAEIVEISDDDDDAPVQPISRTQQMQRQIDQLRQENIRLKHDSARTAKELGLVRAQLVTAEKGKAKAAIDSDMDEYLSCEICTSRLWTPCLLPDCGHTFCKSCLFDWFNQTYNQHLASNPQYQPQRAHAELPANVKAILRTIAPGQLALVQQLLDLYGLPAPKYTCPSCRREAKTRPTEVYGFKKLIHVIAESNGEKEPAKAAPSLHGTRSRRGMPAAQPEDAWAKFFPA
ncbi:hypothetical protein BD626DRAFT_554435 [Schizophyllum amplum]|uniref:RING-type domain-containing protein n=1 Tax=Schizophyllum amplum TaxID=97359 RepID=A0A550CZV7_9AGAR|nr:hypothetical protein BD626DRAFT_554435 [Auriculariopsis ampla]